jgi:predicted exporter
VWGRNGCLESALPASHTAHVLKTLDRLLGWVTRHPVWVIVGVGLIAGVSLLAVRRLRLGESIYDLFPDRPGPITDLAAFTRALGGRQELVALVSGLDAAAVEQGTRKLAERLAASPLISSVRAGPQAAEASELLGGRLLLLADDDAWPEVSRRLQDGMAAQVQRLRQLLLSPVAPSRRLLAGDPLLLSEQLLASAEGGISPTRGLYASRDGRAALVFADPRGPSSDSALCRKLHEETERIAAALAPLKVQFGGAHLYAFYVARSLQRDLAVSSLLALAGVVLVQLLFFRSLRLIPLSALTGGAALALTLAVAALAVGHLSALSLAFAALFIGMADDALIHITAASRGFLDQPPGVRLRRAALAVAPAMLTATATVVAAFLCFALSSFAGLSHLGVLAAAGLGINVLLVLTLFPAMGTLVPPGPGPSGATLVDRWLERLSELAERRAVWVVLVCVALAAGGVLAARGLRFSDDLTRLAPADLPPAQTDRAIAAAFERQRDRLVVIARGRELQPVLEVNDALAARLGALRRGGQLAGYQSAARLLPARATQEQRLARLRALGPEQIAARLRATLDSAGLDPAAFGKFLDALAHPPLVELADLPSSLRPLLERQLVRRGDEVLAITLVYPSAGTDARALAAALERESRPAVRIGVTGAALAGAQMAQLLRRDLLVISLSTSAAVLLLLALLVRRLWPVLATLLSLLFAGLLFVALLRLLHLEMDLYGLMVLPIIIGYGVDDHLYLVHRSLDGGLREGLVHSGRPVLAATLSTMAALAALLFCQLPGLRTLGLTGVLGLGLGLLTSLLVMPALLALPRRRAYPRA